MQLPGQHRRSVRRPASHPGRSTRAARASKRASNGRDVGDANGQDPGARGGTASDSADIELRASAGTCLSCRSHAVSLRPHHRKRRRNEHRCNRSHAEKENQSTHRLMIACSSMTATVAGDIRRSPGSSANHPGGTPNGVICARASLRGWS